MKWNLLSLTSGHKFCIVSPLLSGVRLNYCWVLFMWFSTSEGILTLPLRVTDQSSKLLIQDGRIFAVQKIRLVQNLTNSISRNKCKAVYRVFHLAMFSIMTHMIKFKGFWCCLTWEVLVKLSRFVSTNIWVRSNRWHGLLHYTENIQC